MPVRATKRGDERTPLDRAHDVLICGASFAGLVLARELAGSGASVMVIDRYEIGERQTSACGIPTDWLRATGLLEAELPALRLAAYPHPARDDGTTPPLELLDLRLPRAVRAALGGLRRPLRDGKGERPRAARRRGRGDRGRDRPRRPHLPPRRRRARVAARPRQRRRLPAARRPSLPGARGPPRRRGEEMEVWIDRRYVPAGYGWSFPAGDELRIGVGSFDPRFHVRDTTVLLAEDLGKEPTDVPGQLDPPQAAPRDRGRRLLRRRLGRPLPAAHRGGDQDGVLLRDRPRGRAARGARRAPEPRGGRRPLRRVQRLPRAEVPLDAPRPAPRAANPAAAAGADHQADGLAAVRRLVLQPLPEDRPAGVRGGLSARSERVPAISRATPTRRSGESATSSRPNRPSRSIATEAVS